MKIFEVNDGKFGEWSKGEKVFETGGYCWGLEIWISEGRGKKWGKLMIAMIL